MTTKILARFHAGELLVDVHATSRKASQQLLYKSRTLLPLSKEALPLDLMELFEFFLVYYAADRVTPRDKRRWTRDLHIEFPVWRLQEWQSCCEHVSELIWRSTGDRVTIRPTPRPDDWIRGDAYPHLALEPAVPTGVVLLSDGLDSLCGALDAIKAPSENVAFVSVITNSNRESRIRHIRRYLKAAHGERAIFHRVRLNLIDPPSKQERTQRSRTMLAIAAGLTTCAAYGSSSVSVSENGMGILNLPAPGIQARHESSQVLHPHNQELWAHVSRRLLNGATVLYPNRYRTKAEMIQAIAPAARYLIKRTSSCDAPQRRDREADCGVCGSCVFRRLSLRAAGFSQCDKQYTKQPPRDKLYDPLAVLRRHAAHLQNAIARPDPWAALVELQPTLRDSITAVERTDRDHSIAATIELIRHHVEEMQTMEYVARAV